MKLWKKALSVTMAASMCVTGLPIWGDGVQNVNAAEKKTAESKFLTNLDKDINKKEKKNYKELKQKLIEITYLLLLDPLEEIQLRL